MPLLDFWWSWKYIRLP